MLRSNYKIHVDLALVFGCNFTAMVRVSSLKPIAQPCLQTQQFIATITINANLTATVTGAISLIGYNSLPGALTAKGSGGTDAYTYLWYLNGASTVACPW